ncbi:hypothetical protein L227DRAFT_578679 [Lentinus tigrinus ALCF2SS1-6]|uniref:Uncharacterized protein n=1 Tax=Lentinus tigrinus ALCF2SS1-6 TaxID=1328759 RepID=A0A5C2S1M6_9APHY|nr:hypothetical protein L227DRAFT_578679 [Lentinus tigrinus ALCF2SS1-6]
MRGAECPRDRQVRSKANVQDYHQKSPKLLSALGALSVLGALMTEPLTYIISSTIIPTR